MNIDVNKTAKAYSKEQISINASAQKIFKLISDINNWTLWQKKVTHANINGDFKPGATFNWKTGGLSIFSKIHTANPFSEIGWTGKIWWITAVHNWLLKEENGICIVIVEESFDGFLSGLMRKSLNTGMIENLRELKIAAEMN